MIADELLKMIRIKRIVGVSAMTGLWLSGYDSIYIEFEDGSRIIFGAGGEDHGIQVEYHDR